MSAVGYIQSDFTAGQISERLLQRVDLDTYKHGAKTIENAYPFVHGGVRRRCGSYFIEELRNSTEAGRLIPFVFSRTAAYVLVFNDQKIQFITDGVFITDGGGYVEIDSPYLEDELDEIDFAQIGATMYIVHPNHPPKILLRISDTNWTLDDVPFEYRASTEAVYENGYVTMEIIAGTTAFEVGDTFSISAANVVTPGGSNVGNGTVVGTVQYITNQVWTVTCVLTIGSRQEWTVSGSVSGVTAAKFTLLNFPGAVAVFEQRLYFSGCPSYPQTIYGSSLDSYTDLSLGSHDAAGVEFTIASNNYDEVIHLESTKYLLPLTYGSEFSIFGSDVSGITPSTVSIQSTTQHGCATATPIRIGDEVLFVERGGKKVRAISYSISQAGNVAPDITILSEDITTTGIVDATFAATPDYVAWFVLEEGKMISLTHARSLKTTSWASHTTDGLFENVCTIPEGLTDVTYMIVNREVDGNTVRYVEYLEYSDEVHVDSCLLAASGTAKTSWTGLDHLEGKRLAVVGDGYVVTDGSDETDITVVGGAVELPYEVSNVQFGLPYNTTIETLHPHIVNREGSSQGKKISVHYCNLKLKDTVGCTLNGLTIPFRKFGDYLDNPVESFTGDLEQQTDGWGKDQTMLIEQRIPKPFTLLGLSIKISVND